MARDAQSSRSDRQLSRGIVMLFWFWLACVIGVVLILQFIEPTGTSESSADYGMNRAVPAMGLAGAAVVSSALSAVKTRRRRKQVKRTVRSLGYCPILFTLSFIGTVVHRIFVG